MSQEKEETDLNAMDVDDSPSLVEDDPLQQADNVKSSSLSGSITENPHDKLYELNKKRVKFQQLKMKEFWDQITTEMGIIDSSSADFSDQEISVSLVQNLIRNEAIHLGVKEVEADRSAACALSKICELFVLEMAMRSNLSRQLSLQNDPLQKKDVIATIRDFELYDLFAEHL
jgi:hypothetical protein